MNAFLEKIKVISKIEDAKEILATQIKISKKLNLVMDFCIKAHLGQERKSGGDYAVHPILVAAIVAHFSKNETIVAGALLHDVVEDTGYDLEYIKKNYGDDIALLVDGLTKIGEIKGQGLNEPQDTKELASALTFRKMLMTSIDDAKVLFIKLCDRLHNMMSLNVFHRSKQTRIAEETLIVYVPIAHRLGISSIKNTLEDLAFLYKYPDDYQKIDTFIKEHQHQIQLFFNQFIASTKISLEQNGYNLENIKIFGRIKHYYSIYLKMQRKGVNIDEVLDLLAIRILVPEQIDCYKTLGIIHSKCKPLIARFKDYIATPKENGYQTLHTTVFYDSKVYEVQIRTFDMNKIAEFGIAAHWLYKTNSDKGPNLAWLKSLAFANENVEEFYSDAKQDLFSEDIVVFSPRGDTFTLPRGATAYDFAYAIHTDVGNKALECYINRIKKPLLTELKSSDMISIITSEHLIPRCSWLSIVKTSRAKKSIKTLCANRIKELNEKSGKNILDTIFSKCVPHITKNRKIHNLQKIPIVLEYLKNVTKILDKEIRKNSSFVSRLSFLKKKIKKFKFDNILIYSNFSINYVSFDCCCHPKFGDAIVTFKEGNRAVIHHKMCEQAYKKIKAEEQMLFCQWIQDSMYNYKMVISMANTKGELARLLTYMLKYESYILAIDYGREKYSYAQYCSIEFGMNNSNMEEVKKIIEKQVKVIDFFLTQDAYKK